MVGDSPLMVEQIPKGLVVDIINLLVIMGDMDCSEVVVAANRSKGLCSDRITISYCVECVLV